MLRFILFFLLFSFSFVSSGQQIYQEKFGKNRVQHEKFLWQYISTYNFDVYFHYGGEELARTTADFAEKEISRISEEIDYASYRKYKIFVYNSVDDLEQSNIGLETGEFIGGQTEFVKPIIEVAFEGNVIDFKEQISFGISKTLLNFMMYGGSLKDVFRSSFFLSLPEWYINGAASYLAYGWNSEMDNYIRKKVSVSKLRSPASYKGEEATMVGHSVWNYINEVYGHNEFKRLIDITKIYRKEKKCIELGLNVPYEKFVDNWISFYKDEANADSEVYELAEPKLRTKKRNRVDRQYYEVKISSKGSYMAYATNVSGKYRVYVKDLVKNRKRRLRTGSYKRFDQMIGYNNPSIAWNQDDVLSVVTYKKGKAHHKQYNFKTHNRKVRGLGDFNQTLSFSYSTDGELVLVSGDTRGKTDIWVWDLNRNNLKQLTLDPYNDLDPVFVPNNRFEIVYSSTRPAEEGGSDSLFNLFFYDYRNAKLKILTNEGNNTRPVFKNKDELYFLSDRTGIKNIFCYNMLSGETKQVTRFFYDVKGFDLGQNNSDLLSYVLNEGGKDFMYIDSLSNHKHLAASPYTAMGKKHALKHGTLKDNSTQEEIEDSDEINFDNIIFESEFKKAEEKEAELKREAFSKAELIKVKGPYKYKKIFFVDKITTSIMVDPLRGFGILLDGQMSDLLQQNRFDIGLFVLNTFANSNLYAEYQILKHRWDFKFRFDRQTYLASGEDVQQKYALNKFSVGIFYPLNVHQRIGVTPFVAQTRFSDVSDPATIVFISDVVNVYTGAKAEWVYDFTRYYGLNMKAGNVAKVSFEQYIQTENANKNFGQLVVDIRHYQPLHRALLLAVRLSYGQFVGGAPKQYMLGGMDNWLFNQTDIENPNSPLKVERGVDNSDILFNQFSMNMRGFKYNTQFGQRHLLFNVELRLPVAQYLYRGTVGSAFIRNLQLIAFSDVGSAWNGTSPFSSDNNINTANINEPPFRAIITNYKNPFLISYGVGIRSLLMGYYMKFDLAWGIQNNVIRDPMLHFTLGHDF